MCPYAACWLRQFLGLLKVYDMALPDRFAGPVEDSLYACGDGPVAFVTQSEARFTGPLSLGPELSFPPTGRQVGGANDSGEG